MQQFMNKRMQRYLEQLGINPANLPALENSELLNLLRGIRRFDSDIYSLRSDAPTQEEIGRLSPTGFEASETHIHIETYENRHPEPLKLLITGVSYMAALAQELNRQFPAEIFRVIASYSEGEYPSCVVRFHKYREHDSWLTEDDLESYREEAIMFTVVQG